jgi:hypothetical protein
MVRGRCDASTCVGNDDDDDDGDDDGDDDDGYRISIQL